jgi:hypothetical protein
MASSIKLYTIGAYMQNAICHYASSEATGFNKEMMQDNNPDTYWKPNTTGNSTFHFDLGAAHSPDQAVLCIKNNSLLSTPPESVFQYSDNDSDWTHAGDMTFGGHAHQFRHLDISSAGSHRYWRLNYNAANTEPFISGLWLCKEFDLGQGNEWPENDQYQFFNRISKAGGGRIFSSAISQNHIVARKRTYHFNNNTNFEALRDAFLDSGGRRWPLFINETGGGDFRMAIFKDDKFNSVGKSYKRFNPTVEFLEVPIAASGAGY